MIVTVLWEDQRGGEVKGFGPHELLMASLADDLGIRPWEVGRLVQSHPKKGNANVRKALQKDIGKLGGTRVFAVLDRDKVRELWKSRGPMPVDCNAGIRDRFRTDAPGDYDLVFLVQNVESLLGAASAALGIDKLRSKPNPDERDRLLLRCTGPNATVRGQIRENCQSFDRLVRRVGEALKAVPP
jgi:hypothetical protein